MLLFSMLLLKNAKSGPLSRLWMKIQRDQSILQGPAAEGFAQFMKRVTCGKGNYAYTSDKLFLRSKMAEFCQTCALLADEYHPLGFAMVVTKGAPFRKKMNNMYV